MEECPVNRQLGDPRDYRERPAKFVADQGIALEYSQDIAPAHGTSRRVRETEAEAVAFVVCTAIGLETGSAAQDYTGLYGGDAKLLSESLEYIQGTATQILNAIGADGTSPPA